MSTTFLSKDTVDRTWYQVDASDQVLGRLAVRVARVLMGKNKPTYAPQVDCGDYVVVTGVEGLRLTGRKEDQKVYLHHSGYIGGMKRTPFKQMRARHPEEMFRLAVRRMLPKNRMGREMLSKLKIYAGQNHPHVAQKPQQLP
ncbi:MAG: 50S ribosomal protein L13 [Planctomycetota bacterium]